MVLNSKVLMIDVCDSCVCLFLEHRMAIVL